MMCGQRTGKREFFKAFLSAAVILCLIAIVQAQSEKDAKNEVQGSSVGVQGEALGGHKLFTELGCGVCHQNSRTQIAPTLHGLYGTKVKLQNGETVVADEAYVRESILKPTAKIVAGYQPIMPASFGQSLNAKQLADLVAYIQSLHTLQAKMQDHQSPGAERNQ